jgi:hypothetical protein
MRDLFGVIKRLWTDEKVSHESFVYAAKNGCNLMIVPRRIIAQGGAFVVSAFDGPIEPSMQINSGGSSDAEAFRTVELLAAKVMPRFR